MHILFDKVIKKYGFRFKKVLVCDGCYRKLKYELLKEEDRNMDFFERISKTVTEASQKTIAKTKELTDTSRLNSLISEEEKKITNLYYQIGKLYVSIHREDNEEDFGGMIKSLSDAELKVESYKKQIQDIKGVQRCEKCGAEVPRGVAFCSSCGTAMPKTESVVPNDYVKCRSCGATVKKGMRFCTSCGKPMEETNSSVMSGFAVDSKVTETEADRHVCPNCGTKLDSDLAFCTECGTRL